jgi:hypothetical protein
MNGPDVRRGWLVALGSVLLLALAGCATERQYRPDLETYLRRWGFAPIVLERDHQNHLVLDGDVNGRSRRLLVDTGWSVTTLDRGLGKTLPSLAQVSGQWLDPRMAGIYGTSAVLVASLRLGPAVFTNQPARVEHLSVNGIEGILGCDFLLRNHCVIDCLDRRLYVRSGATPPEIQRALDQTLQASGFHPVRLKLRPSLAATCIARVNGQPLNLVVDTGAQWSVIDSSQVKRLGLAPVSTPGTLSGALSRIHPTGLSLADIKALEFESLTLSNLRVGVASMADWGIRNAGLSADEVDGLLGAYDLTVGGALIDCAHLTLWLRPAQRGVKE